MRQSKRPFDWDKFYDDINSYTFRIKEVLIDQPVYLGRPLQEMSDPVQSNVL